MKKTYAAPTLAKNGRIVGETEGGSSTPNDTVGLIEAIGSVGFYL